MTIKYCLLRNPICGNLEFARLKNQFPPMASWIFRDFNQDDYQVLNDCLKNENLSLTTCPDSLEEKLSFSLEDY